MYDVVVVGGGISGTMAAVAAARNGAATLVIEQYGFLGGSLTAAGVGPMMTFHAGEKQVVRGITGELIDRLKNKGKSPGHIFDTIGYTYTVTPFDIEAMKHELEIMLLESGGKVLYHTMLAEVSVDEKTIESIRICNKSGLTSLKASIFVDATGDADLSVWAGVDTAKGRDTDGACQPMTMNLRMRRVDIDRVRSFVKEHPEEFPLIAHDTAIVDRAPRLSIAGFVLRLQRGRENGEISFKREEILFFETNNPGEVIVNTTRILDKDATDPWSLTQAEIEGRNQVRELEAFLKNRIPGFADAEVMYSGPAVGVRSSRQIKGLYVLEADDFYSCRRFDDTIAHSGYPMDIHPPEGEEKDTTPEERVRRMQKNKEGRLYSIPFRCLVNPRIDNLITVGRCISVSFEVQAGIRTTPIAGAIGHAGGAAASIAAGANLPVRNVKFDQLRTLLIDQGAYLEV